MPEYGEKIKMNVYGESHGDKIGVCISGLPTSFKVDFDELQKFVDRRKAVNSDYSTKRIEPDKIEIVRGLDPNGMITSQTIELAVFNTNQRSGDYDSLKNKPRPSHADYPALVKFNGNVDLRGGGKYSGRLTLPICIAGGVAKQILHEKNIRVYSFLSEVAGVKGLSYKTQMPSEKDLIASSENPFFFFKDEQKAEIDLRLKNAREDLDSLGGIVETVVFGLSVGIGDSLFDGVEGKISSALFGIPAVKGVEFGSGFDFANMSGSTANDEYYFDEDGTIKTYSNHNGGLVGGMTTGMPLTVRAVIKPTPSIAKIQRTVDLSTKTNTTIEIKGRHDVCIAPRAVAPIEASVAFAILDLLKTNEVEE